MLSLIALINVCKLNQVFEGLYFIASKENLRCMILKSLLK